MALVDYSDSEESADEQNKPRPKTSALKPQPTAKTNFSIDEANPQKIHVKLNETTPAHGTHDREPAAKRPRIGGGGFSGFNAMLPPPKRNAEAAQTSNSKAPARKVFSLKTGAEPGFSRDSDAELLNFFAEQDSSRDTASGNSDQDVGIPEITKKAEVLPKSTFEAPKSNAFIFKPLSVARNKKQKKKPTNDTSKSLASAPATAKSVSECSAAGQKPAAAPKKMSLFSSGAIAEQDEPFIQDFAGTVDAEDGLDGSELDAYAGTSDREPGYDEAQSLDSIASDLNLSAADRRQLFGRGGKANSATAQNVMNFNTDREYAANQEMIANGEQVQHNPVRAIAPGKHSLRQLVSAAQSQKDALEESFAAGRRNKREVGNKYGW